MSYWRRPRGLRLGLIDLEAETLIANSGRDAYSVACQRAQEASCETMARDWSGVAFAIARKTRNRPASLIGKMLH
jgi:hypothetical protein